LTTRQYKSSLTKQLVSLYDEREAANIAALLLEEWLGKAALRLDRELTTNELERLSGAENRLLQAEPVQYILGHTWFFDYTLQVNHAVLIPRPETEELVQWMLDELKGRSCNIADLGTGSGAIAIALADKLPLSKVTGTDISAEALIVAEINANRIGVSVNWHKADMLSKDAWHLLQDAHVIVSNPPYIPEAEKKQMHPNVLQWEPAAALFVPDQDPLLFYRSIMKQAMALQQSGCLLFFEIHEQYGAELVELATAIGWSDIQVKPDMQGRNRMMRMRKP
jgi:release factor glutamine methyltransferase